MLQPRLRHCFGYDLGLEAGFTASHLPLCSLLRPWNGTPGGSKPRGSARKRQPLQRRETADGSGTAEKKTLLFSRGALGSSDPLSSKKPHIQLKYTVTRSSASTHQLQSSSSCISKAHLSPITSKTIKFYTHTHPPPVPSVILTSWSINKYAT